MAPTNKINNIFVLLGKLALQETNERYNIFISSLNFFVFISFLINHFDIAQISIMALKRF